MHQKQKIGYLLSENETLQTIIRDIITQNTPVPGAYNWQEKIK